MVIHVVDGTYELFRYFFVVPPVQGLDGSEVGAVRGVLGSVLSLLGGGATHIGVATDHIIESFRNDLWPGYKTGDGIDPLLLSQFEPLEHALEAMGVRVWPMVEFEADDALAAAAARAAEDSRVERVVICTPDKDLAQAVVGDRIVQLDRRANVTRNADGVLQRFGVWPASIRDYLALVGDSSDGYPGLPGWGEKSAAMVLARYEKLEAIPHDARWWDISVRGAAKLATTLREQFDQALLFRTLATLRTDVPVFDSVDELRWDGPTPAFFDLCTQLGAPDLFERAAQIVRRRG